MILMLYLISTNVYISVEAPHNRGFSYIELWQLGAQLPILIALCEYGFVLYFKRRNPKSGTDQNHIHHLYDLNPSLDDKIKRYDYATMIFSFAFFLIFVSFYWFFLSFQ